MFQTAPEKKQHRNDASGPRGHACQATAGGPCTPAKMIDFVEHQFDMLNLTKTECALIQINSTPTGNQTFDLPRTLKRQTGPEKTRKDSYSSLLLGNWMIKLYYDVMGVEAEKVVSTFTPMFIK